MGLVNGVVFADPKVCAPTEATSTMVEPKRELKCKPINKKVLAALAEKPLTTFNIMKRVNIKSQDECQTLLLKMRDEGAVKFDIHKGVWNIVD